MDEAGARMHISNINVPKEIEEQEALLDRVNREKNDAVKCQDFERAANCRDKEKQLQAELAGMKAEWEKEPCRQPPDGYRRARGRRGFDDFGRAYAAYAAGRVDTPARYESRAASQSYSTG